MVPEALDFLERLTEQAERINGSAARVGLDLSALGDLIRDTREEANQVSRCHGFYFHQENFSLSNLPGSEHPSSRRFSQDQIMDTPRVPTDFGKNCSGVALVAADQSRRDLRRGHGADGAQPAAPARARVLLQTVALLQDGATGRLPRLHRTQLLHRDQQGAAQKQIRKSVKC